MQTRPSFQAGFSLILSSTFAVAGCAEIETTETEVEVVQGALASMNGMSMNGMSMNGMSMNGMSMNGMSMNGMSMNGLATVNGLSSTSGLMTTAGGREIVKYMVLCALPVTRSLTKQDQNGVSYTFPGSIGVAPELEYGPCNLDCQERVSACMLAHVNNAGLSLRIWLDSEGAVGWGASPDFPYQEGSFFGNLFPVPWQGFYCNGKHVDAGSVPGRLGQPLASNVYVNPFGANVECGQTSQCSAHGSDGYNSCNTNISGVVKTWTKIVTVWRNFDANTVYKICNYGTNKCLGVAGASTADNAAMNEQTYAGGAHQKFWVLQVSPGKYKVVNVNSGKAITASGTALVQKPYMGLAFQNAAFNTLGSSGQFGRYTIIPSSGAAGFFFPSSIENATATLTGNLSIDTAKWTVVPVGTQASP